MSVIRLATRSSPLARWQAERVADLLRARHGNGLTCELVFVETLGDRDRERPLHELGGQGVFVKEVQAAVLDGQADVAVHSAKDLPSLTAPGLVLVAVPERSDPRDVLVGAPLAGLGPGATVATGSVRRRAQLANLRPDLHFVELRGNIATRLGKVPPHGAIVMAAAALERLGLQHHIAEVLDPAVMLPQVAQGALALECRTDDPRTSALVAAVDDLVAHRCVRAERAFLAELGGGCDLPVGAYAQVQGDGSTLRIEGLIASPDGASVRRRVERGDDPEATGRLLAAALVASSPSTS